MHIMDSLFDGAGCASVTTQAPTGQVVLTGNTSASVEAGEHAEGRAPALRHARRLQLPTGCGTPAAVKAGLFMPVACLAPISKALHLLVVPILCNARSSATYNAFTLTSEHLALWGCSWRASRSTSW